MNDKAEKVYAEAFFELCTEQCPDKAEDILSELDALNAIFTENPGFIKIMSAPTVPVEEKTALTKEIITAGGVSELTGNLLCVLAERGRMNCFSGIVKIFRAMYNEHFGIAEITVTTKFPLTDKLRADIAAKMGEVTGKKISIKEKIDPSVIGGIIIDHGSARYDGSIRTRLNALKDNLAEVIS